MAFGKLKIDQIETSTQTINLDEFLTVTRDEVEALRSRFDKLQHENCIYVTLNGDDANTGTVDSPLRTVKAAADIAQPGDVVYIAAGTYVEAELPIRWKYDVTIFGAGLRSTIIQPAPGQEFNDIFKVDSGFWCWGISFAGHQADETFQSWAVSFDELADNRDRGAVGLGAFILKSPYIQNCTSITAEDDSGLAGSQSTGNTGGGIKVDGDQCSINSPIRSMVVDSYTQVNLGGPGCLVVNDGYAQLVSFFGTFCTYHVRTETGGQVNLSGGGTTDFGLYGLMADGYSKTPLYTGSSRTNYYGAMRLERSVTIDVDTDTFSSASHTLVENDQITFKATQGLLPTNLEPNTLYYVISSGLTENEFKVSATQGGPSIDLGGTSSGTYLFERLGVTEVDVVDFTPNRLGRKIKYPSAGSKGSPGNPVSVLAVNGNFFTVALDTSTIKHDYLGGGTVQFSGNSYPVTSAAYDETTGITTLSASGFVPSFGDAVTLSGLAFICNSASRPNSGQLMFPQLVFPRNAVTEEAEAKTFAYTRISSNKLSYIEAASPDGPEHVYVSGGTATINGVNYGVSAAEYNKDTGEVILTTLFPLPPADGNVLVEGLRFICPSSAYVVTSSVPIDANGNEVENTSPDRAGYRVIFYSGLNGGLKNPLKPGQKLDFRSRSQISAPSHTFEYVGSGTNYDALPWNGGVPVPANAIVETNNGKVYSSNTNEKGDFSVGSQFSIDGTSGSVTISTDQFNLSGLNFIGPFSRNGGFSTVGEQLREVSNNTSLIASTGAADSNTTPTQFAVKSYADNKFLTDVAVSSDLPLSISDTSTQDSQGYWTRTREISLSVNEPEGLVRLDSSGIVPSSLLPSYVDDVLEFDDISVLPDPGETGKIYVALDTGRAYRWSGSTYIEVSPPPTNTDTVPEGTTNLYFTQDRARQSLSVGNNNGLTYDSGTGVFSFTLPNTGVAAGTYTYSSITVDEKGRITSAQSGTNPVISVGLQAPTGFSVTSSPVTGTGNLIFSYAEGYSLPTNAKQLTWDTAYTERRYWDGGSSGLNATTGRTSLGLGNSATLNVGTVAGTVAAGNDARLSDARTPLSHKSTHAIGGSDALSPADIGAEPAGTAASAISTHVAAADPHPGYALESSLGGAALLNVGTTAGTVAAGNDSRFTTNLTYTASTRLLASSTGADVTLPLFTSTLAGLTPSSGGGTTNYLRADGSWSSPVGGTTGQLQWNSSGSFAGVGGSTVGTTGAITLGLNGAADTPPLRLTGTWATGFTSTTTKPQLLIEPAGTTSTEWSTSGTGLGVNAPSGFAGNLLDLQVNGVSQLKISSDGTYTGQQLAFSRGSTLIFGADSSQFYTASSSIGISVGGYNRCLMLGEDLGVLALRRSTVSHSLRCYGTYSNSSSYVRVALGSTSTSASLAAETGDGSALSLELNGAGDGTVKINSVAEVASSSTVAGLPTSPVIGMITRVTDATSPTLGATVSGGGSAAALVWYNGANWTVLGL